MERLNAAADKEGIAFVENHKSFVARVIPFDEPTEISVLIEDEEDRTFAPDPGECERGIPVKRLRH